MRVRTLRALLIILAATLTSPAAAESFGLDALMAGLRQQRGGEVTYSETKHLSTLKTPLVSEGLLRFRHPDYLEKEVRKPAAERYVIAGDALEVYRGSQLKHVMMLSDHPVMESLMTSLIATMGGDLQALQKHFTVSLSGARAAWTLKLLPLDSALRDDIQTIEIRGAGDVIRSFEVRQRNGDRSLMTLSQLPS